MIYKKQKQKQVPLIFHNLFYTSLTFECLNIEDYDESNVETIHNISLKNQSEIFPCLCFVALVFICVEPNSNLVLCFTKRCG